MITRILAILACCEQSPYIGIEGYTTKDIHQRHALAISRIKHRASEIAYQKIKKG